MDAVKIYEEYFKRKQDVLSGMVNYYKERGDTIALWGAGKKGTGFLNVADPGNKMLIMYLIKIFQNPDRLCQQAMLLQIIQKQMPVLYLLPTVILNWMLWI